MSLNILIISYYFPPYNKVGARRWAKYGKYLKKEGINFHVLAAEFKGFSPWNKDIVSFGDNTTRIKVEKRFDPYHLKKLPNNIFQKIYWKISLILWENRKRNLQGNYMDISHGNENSFYVHAKEMMTKKKINTVVLSVGPFSYSSILPKLKNEFSSIKVVIDYRDYWEDEFSGLNDHQIDFERRKQLEVLRAVDLVLIPNQEMADHYKIEKNKSSYILPHAFDVDDMHVNKYQNIEGRSFKLIYGGAFYEGLEESIKLIKECLEELNKEKETEAEFYVSLKGYESELTHPLIKRYNFIASNEYFSKVGEASFAILILPANRVNAMSSKFFELLALRKPILYFGGEGEVSEFLLKNNLGFHIINNRPDVQIKNILEKVKNKVIPDINFDLTNYTFEHQTKLLLKKLETL
jgi:hypothetical protein